MALTYAGPDDLGLSLWHMACGLTQAVQGRTRHSDERMVVDEAVGRVLAAA